MTRQTIHRMCATTPLLLSLMACVWVLGNVAGGARAGGDEGLGFYIFWLLILAEVPFILGYLATAGGRRVTARIALQLAALVLAFSPVAYFKL